MWERRFYEERRTHANSLRDIHARHGREIANRDTANHQAREKERAARQREKIALKASRVLRAELDKVRAQYEASHAKVMVDVCVISFGCCLQEYI